MRTHLKIASTLAKLLDNQFSIFGFRFGIDPIVGVIPVFGDIIPVLISIYMIWIGVKMKLPQAELNKMVGNVVLDLILGAFPVLGDLADFAFHAHQRNLEILNKHRNTIIEGELI